MKEILIDRLSVKFGDKTVFSDFSLSIPAGETTCLMGPSGCGKTTLSMVLLGLLVPDAGSVSGVPEKCAAVFQEDRLCEDLTVLSNLRFSASGHMDQRRARSLLTDLGLSGEVNSRVRSLSGGMKRRVALARALVSDYDLLILDEPFKGLDEVLRRGCIEVIRKECAGKTVICITHDRRDADLLGASVVSLPYPF